MLIGARNAMLAGAALPYDAEVEYLESTGTQWIDTGIISNGTGLTVEVTCSKTTSSTQEMSVVGRSLHDGFEIYAYNSRFSLWNSSGIVPTNPTAISANEIYNVIGSTVGGITSIKVNDVISSMNKVLAYELGNIELFRHNRKYNWVGRIYSCKIYVNGVLVRDYIPVRKGTVGHMYDRVSGELFRNAGTGAFAIGPDASGANGGGGISANA